RNDAFVLVVGAGLLEEAADLSRLADAAGSLTRGALVVVDEADDRIACEALDAGLDYVRDTAIERDLAARVRSLVRRAASKPPATLYFGDLVIDVAAREVRVRGASIALTAREFDLLAFLASAPRVAFSREELLRQVWRSSPDSQGLATVTEHVRRIREKLQPDGTRTWLQTIRGTGYLFGP
ncbi:MAG TPA: response regulator transcription factor, partial [Acidimicrobiia bacterium]|nr:response regulator transcription factor [Acidimicrobiia bacterium]